MAPSRFFIAAMCALWLLAGAPGWASTAASQDAPAPSPRAGEPDVKEFGAHLRQASWYLQDLSGFSSNGVSADDAGAALAHDPSIYDAAPEYLVGDSAGPESAPDVAAFLGGGFLIAWEAPLPEGQDILAQRMTSDGIGDGQPILVCSAPGDQLLPAAGAAAGGEFAVAWEDRRQSDPAVMLQRFDRRGNANGSEVRVGEGASPDISVEPGGNFSVVWTQVKGERPRILLQRFAPDGNRRGEKADVGAGGPTSHPRISAGSNGEVMVAWSEWRRESGHDILARRFDGGGRGEAVVICAEMGNQTEPSVAVGPGGGSMVVWTDDRGGTGDIRGRASLPGAWPDRLFPVCTALADQLEPELASGPDGKYIALWRDLRNSSGSCIYAQQLDSWGNRTGDELLLSELPGSSCDPAAAFGSGDSFMAAGRRYVDRSWRITTHLCSHFRHLASGTLATPDLLAENLTTWGELTADSVCPGPEGSYIRYQASPDGGATWRTVPQNGSLAAVPAWTGKIRVRAELRTSDPRSTPLLRSLTLTYYVDRPPQILSLTGPGGPAVFRKQTVYLTAIALDPDGDPLEYRWSQIDGPAVWLFRSDTSRPGFTPQESGGYTFRLAVWDGWCESPPAFVSVQVTNRPPGVTITLNCTPYKNIPVHLFGSAYSADGTIMNYDWKLVAAPPFTTLLQPTKPDIILHAFFTGNCTVALTVTDDRGISATQNISFAFIGHPPVAMISSDRQWGHPGQSFLFDALGSSDPDRDQLSYRFDFGDGNLSDWTARPQAEHSYDLPGAYTVKLHVRDSDGYPAQAAQLLVQVRPPNAPPAASFTVRPGNLTVPFIFTSTSADRDGTVISCDWDFGDGTSGSGAAVEHLYGRPGNYTVRLVVRDDDGDPAACYEVVNINRRPELRSRTETGDRTLMVREPLTLTLSAEDPDGDSLACSWYVNGELLPGEGNSTLRFVPTSEGNFRITAVVDDGRGGTLTVRWDLAVVPRPPTAGPPTNEIAVLILAVLALQLAYLFRKPLRALWRHRRGRGAPDAPAPPSVAEASGTGLSPSPPLAIPVEAAEAAPSPPPPLAIPVEAAEAAPSPPPPLAIPVAEPEPPSPPPVPPPVPPPSWPG